MKRIGGKLPPTEIAGKMINNILQEIERLHDECSKMDKASKIGYLLGYRQRLYSMADQMATFVALNGGRMTPGERVQARNLLEMIDAVNEEGRRTGNELLNEAVFGLMKMMGK